MMEYKGYVGVAEYDDEAEIFHGEVINTRDVITFRGKSVKELKNDFHDSIDGYINYCEKLGESPEKPFSGKCLLRIAPELHRKIYIEAKRKGVSVNAWITASMEKMLALGI